MEIALTYIYGIGKFTSQQVLQKANVTFNKKVKDLSDEEVTRIRNVIESELTVEGSLRARNTMNIKRLTDIGCYRGVRHRKGLPVRGQRTRTNARTRKGPRRTVANKKIAPSKG